MTQPRPVNDLIDIAAVAQRLGVQVRHVRRLVHERRIPYIKWGHLIRFDPTDIATWIEQSRIAPSEASQRSRALILTAAFSSLRQGELFGLRRRDVDLLHREVKVERQAQTPRGAVIITPPKSRAGVRTVALPARLVPELEHHLSTYVAVDRDALVFCGVKGAPLTRNNWTRKWHEALKAADVEGLHFHDLRHTGNTLAAATGASTKELMARMGHASPRAALTYQHATRERDMAIADALDQLIGRAAPASPSAPVRALPPASEQT